MIITTSQKNNLNLIKKATEYARKLNINFIHREDLSLENLFEIDATKNKKPQVIIVKQKGLFLYTQGIKNPFFFHPSTAIIRIKRLEQGYNDTMIDICQLKPGDYFLDCTLGLGTDSIVASYIVGASGKVIGIESKKEIALIVAEGSKQCKIINHEIKNAINRINVINDNHLTYLRSLPNKSVDVIYFDPMFEHGIYQSDGIKPLREIADFQQLTSEVIYEAKRVARKRIVLKARNNSLFFDKFDFKKIIRANRKFTFGYIEIR